MIEFDQQLLQNFSQASTREWLETNGIGGFSASTVIGMNTRRYHGLLTAATRPPVGRLVLLSKLEETIVIDDRRYDLSVNQYPSAVHPQGFQFQTRFRLDPFPIFTYVVAGVEIEKSVFMVQGENTVVIHYELTGSQEDARPIRLEVRPLIAFRDYHGSTHENDALNRRLEVSEGVVSVKPYADSPVLHLAHDRAELNQSGDWYRNFQYQIERERGLDFQEDLYSPFALTFNLDESKVARLIASTDRSSVADADRLRDAERSRRADLITIEPGVPPIVSQLSAAADQYIVARAGGNTVIAGYHWFSDWGRDTMIALPGLTLVNGKTEIAKSILSEFALHVDKGMLPNRFPDAGETPEYNTVDATLWFFEAARALLHYTSDYDFARARLYDVLKDIIAWHVRGTRYGIKVDSDGLLKAGEPGVQLTWMDAKIGDWVVTPRHGKPVEIQALWYNALRIMEGLAAKLGEASEAERFRQMSKQAEQSFSEQFWNEAAGCLFDVVNGAEKDATIRPNQIFAISLNYSLVSGARAESVMRVMERELLTPRGLRSLPPSHPDYHGVYEGGPSSRDSVYHQGTVWPWLMGAYITAFSKTFGLEAGRRFGDEWLTQFAGHLEEACVGQISEIFDADAPHLARGCAAQAWSVAELLRAAREDVYQTKFVAQGAK